jgi:predicted phage terminase large subunit-like protein
MELLKNRHQYQELLERIAELDDPIPVLRDLCKGDLFFLLVYGMSRKDADKDWLFYRCREVQAEPNGMLDLWSREHYKSTIITFALTIQDILNNPDITIGIFSHTRPNAKGFLRQIKREFELNQNLKSWFPDILYENPSKEAIKWSEDDGIIVKRKSNPKEGTVEAWGVVDGQPTGKHFSLLVYDDIVTKESVTTPDMIEKTTDALALSYNLGAHGGQRRFIGTRYHFADTYKTIMDRGTAIPRIHAATHDGSMTGNPVFLTDDQLSGKRRDMGPYVFSCQMLQNPVADSSQGFNRAWIRHYDGEIMAGYNWHLLVDAANGKRKSNDYTSIWAVGLGPDGNYYCIPEVRDRINLTERTVRLMDLHRKYRPVQVRYEQYGMQSDLTYIQSVMNQSNYRFDIIEVGGSMSKIDRIKRLIPLFETGKIYLPRVFHVTDYEGKTRNNVHDFIESEFVPFPVPLHDDMLDSLARICESEGKLAVWDKKIDLKLDWPEIKRPNNSVNANYTSGGWMG